MVAWTALKYRVLKKNSSQNTFKIKNHLKWIVNNNSLFWGSKRKIHTLVSKLLIQSNFPANLLQMGHLLLYLITLKMKLILNSNKNSTSNSNHRKLRKRDRKLVLHYYLKIRHNNRNIPCHFFIQELICFQWTCTIASLIETDLRTQ